MRRGKVVSYIPIRLFSQYDTQLNDEIEDVLSIVILYNIKYRTTLCHTKAYEVS